MHQSKIISRLREFPRVELTRLKDFVASPYFNKHDKVISLMNILYDLYPDWDSAKLKKERIQKQLFPGEPFENRKLSHIMNYLVKLVEDFIAIESFNKKELLKQHYIVRDIRTRSSGKLYEQQLSRMQKLLDNTTHINAEYFYFKNLHENELDYFYLNRKKTAATDHMQNKSDNLDLFYLTSKLEYWCDMWNRSNVLNIEYEYPLLEEVLQHIEANADRFLEIPYIKTYYLILHTLQEPEKESHYQRLKDHLKKHSDEFASEEARTMYDYAQNYCIKKINLGDSKYVAELLFLYKLMLEKDLIYENGYFPPSDFKNIVTIACRLKEFDWTEDFIYRYKHTLAEKTREHVFQYNLAALYYERGDYKQALKLLREVEFTDTYFALGARSMLMKIYYEIGETDPLFSHFDAFRTYLRRNRLISNYQRKVHLNFIRFTKRAYNLKMKSDWERKKILKQQAEKLMTSVKQSEEITNRNWLEEKVNAFI